MVLPLVSSKYFDTNPLPAAHSHAMKMVSLFGITYLCEQVYSRMKNVKSKTRTRITNTHLENPLRIASYQIKADIDSNKVTHGELKVPKLEKKLQNSKSSRQIK